MRKNSFATADWLSVFFHWCRRRIAVHNKFLCERKTRRIKLSSSWF